MGNFPDKEIGSKEDLSFTIPKQEKQLEIINFQRFPPTGNQCEIYYFLSISSLRKCLISFYFLRYFLALKIIAAQNLSLSMKTK